MKSFQEKVFDIVKNIPQGKVFTYAQVASLVGSPRAVRAVGTVLNKNVDKDIPCHRIIKSDGSIGRYNGLRGKSKREVLEREGVIFTKKGKVVYVLN